VGPYGDGGGKNERDFARTYARKGMVVFLPDYFPGRHSDEDPAQVQAAVAAYGPFLKEPAKAQRVALLALQQLTSLDFVDADKVGVVGFCFGGAMALNMARAGGKAKVVVSLHGEYPERGSPTASYNVDYFVEMIGDSDPFIPPEKRDAWIKELSDYTKGTKMDYDVEIWGNSVHAFSIKYSDAFNQVIATVSGSKVDATGVTGVVRYEPDRAAASFDRVDDLFAQHGLLGAGVDGGAPSGDQHEKGGGGSGATGATTPSSSTDDCDDLCDDDLKLEDPTEEPSKEPTVVPSKQPTSSPSVVPAEAPTADTSVGGGPAPSPDVSSTPTPTSPDPTPAPVNPPIDSANPAAATTISLTMLISALFFVLSLMN